MRKKKKVKCYVVCEIFLSRVETNNIITDCTQPMPKDFWQHLGQRIMARTASKPRRMYPCGKCQKIYSNASSLYRHLKLECGMLPQFHCPYCRFSSKRKFNLDSHVAHKHSKLLNCYVNKLG